MCGVIIFDAWGWDFVALLSFHKSLLIFKKLEMNCFKKLLVEDLHPGMHESEEKMD